MKKLTGKQRKSLAFWAGKIKAKACVINGASLPDKYSRKFLIKEGLLVRVKSGLYILKKRENSLKDLIFRTYWQIISTLMGHYKPWAIEKTSALKLYLGDESIPSLLVARTAKKINYCLEIFPGLKIQIHHDNQFNEKTRQLLELGQAQLFLDMPERVLFTTKNRGSANFKAFIKAFKFNRVLLEALYENNPKPIVAKALVNVSASINPQLAGDLKNIIKKYTIYRT
jgi:hypothetical protein